MMKGRIFAGLAFALMAVLPLFASPESPGREDPIQVGYVIITPVTEQGAPVQEKTALVAFETFGEKKSNSMTPVGVLPSAMTKSAMLFANASGRLSRDVGVAVANPSPSTTKITMTLKDESGKDTGHADFALEGGKQQAAFVSEMFKDLKEKGVPQDFTGNLFITSDTNPVAMMGLRSRGENYSTLPLTILDTPAVVPLLNDGAVGGSGAIILAHFAVGGGWDSEIVLASSDSEAESALLVRVDLFTPDGLPLEVTLNGETGSSFTDISIPPGGVHVLARRDKNGDTEF